MSLFASLNPRERLLVLVVLPAVALVALYQFAWLPLQEERAARAEQIAGFRTVAYAARRSETTPSAVARPADPRPMAARVTATAQAAGLPLRRLEPEGRRIRVTADEIDFTTLIAWIAELETTARLALVSLEVDRRAAPGIVSARLILEEGA
ncbi:MAG: type II secretion system protein GspM [Pseudomonadota bacterium]